ncbi:MAG TPA: arginine repressor [Sphingomicrobium sp.]|nr:arginine repressor [Sphingomicrobium sp.]
MTKHQRQRLIADWLREHRVGSQEELVARLSMSGIAATQATVSRDLLELGAVKLKRDGSIRYVMPDQVEAGHAAAKLDRLLAEWVDAIIPAGNMIVLKTPPGSANLVANALDAAGMDEVAGTLAGDDTIFVAITDGTNPQAVASMLQRRRSGA